MGARHYASQCAKIELRCEIMIFDCVNYVGSSPEPRDQSIELSAQLFQGLAR